ncbi:MAG TPA: hypothetical protein VIL72_05445 [Beijerinckiaceae bacterium]|jgi:hypothetical protein
MRRNPLLAPFLAAALLAVPAAVGAQEAQTPRNETPLLRDGQGDLSDKLQRNDGVIKPPPVDSQMPTPTPPTNSDMPVIKPPQVQQQTPGDAK